MADTLPYSVTVSCGGTKTQWDWSGNPDAWAEHASLKATVRDLQRQVNAMKDLMERQVGWWTRFRLTRYLRTRSE